MDIEPEEDEQGGWEIVKQEAKKETDSNQEPVVSWTHPNFGRRLPKIVEVTLY